MSRLITFGCSYTYGDSLPDCLDPYHSDPSQYAWPSLLGNLLNLETVNMSTSGSGNLEILWNVLNFDFQESDMCIIMWSHFSRDHIFTSKGCSRIDAHGYENITKHWSLTHTEYDLAVRNWIYIHHAACYLSKIKNNFYIISGNLSDTEINCRPSFVRTDNYLDLVFCNVDYGNDNSHPGVKSQAIMATRIYNSIQGSISQK